MKTDRTSRLPVVLGWVLLCGICAAAVPDSSLRTIRFEGMTRIRPPDAMAVMGLKTGTPLPGGWLQSAMRNLVSRYLQMGYALMRVDSIRLEQAGSDSIFDLTVWIDESERIRVGFIALVETDGEPATELMRGFETMPGRYFDPEVLEDDIETLLRIMENEGYPLAAIRILSLDFVLQEDRPNVHIELGLDRGPLVFLEDVRASGNEMTKAHVITRELSLKKGSVYDHRQIIRARDKLRRMEMFRRVQEPRVRFSGNRAFVVLEVEEGNSNTLDGVIGYSPSEKENQKGSITGRIHLSFRNLLGTGRFFEAFWQKKDDFSQSMRFRFEEPWILGWPVHAGAGFQQEIRDSTYIERIWNVSLRVSLWTTLSVLIEGSHRQVLPDSAGSQLMGIPRSESWMVSGIIDYNTLDDGLNPRTGVRYRTTVTVGRKNNLNPEIHGPAETWKPVVSTRRIDAHAEFCLNPFQNQVIYIGLHGVDIRTGDPFVPLSDQVRFGGTTTLRGYREDVFRGSLAAWSNLEYRLLVGRQSRVFVFVDSGIFQRREENGLIRGIRIGYGFGIRLQTGIGIVGIDFGLGKGDGLLDAKVHIGLLNRF